MIDYAMFTTKSNATMKYREWTLRAFELCVYLKKKKNNATRFKLPVYKYLEYKEIRFLNSKINNRTFGEFRNLSIFMW